MQFEIGLNGLQCQGIGCACRFGSMEGGVGLGRKIACFVILLNLTRLLKQVRGALEIAHLKALACEKIARIE